MKEMATASGLRLVHLSDVHITADTLGWGSEDWWTKRLPGWFNYRWLGRRQRFQHADHVLATLIAEVRQRPPDHFIFSGDATALGFEAEFAHAAELMAVNDPALARGLAVPGNHDYYTSGVAASGLFERYFAPWQHGERLNGAVYPFAQRVGPIWLIGVNSCTGNRWFWDAGGSVGAEQLGRLRQLLDRLGPGLRILVTHYPVRLANGTAEGPMHYLRDLDDVLQVARAGKISLWLHGHRHNAYHLVDPKIAPFPILCVGSATQTSLWSYAEYTIDGLQLQVRRRVYSPAERRFQDGESFSLQLLG